MIETLYAVNFLKGYLQRFKKYNRINATIDCGDNYVSFYAKDDKSNKQYLARGSNHHLRMQHLADKDEPWKGDNISIEFITPNSPQDFDVRGRVKQNHYGGIKPFDVTIYQYDNTILDERDLSQIFRSIISFLNGMGYTDPFANTPKAAIVKPRTSNIRPYKEPTKKARNISVDRNGNWDSANGWGADYVSENNRIKTNRNMNKKPIRLTESDLHTIVEDVVSSMMNENWGSNFWGKLGYNQNDLKPQMQQQQGQQQRQQYQSQGQQQQTQPQQQQGQQQLQQYKQQIRQYLTSADNYVNMALSAIEDGDYNYVTQALNKIKEILTPIYMGRI